MIVAQHFSAWTRSANISTFDRPEGGMCIAAGNGIVSGTPFENIEAFLEEALEYGQRHRQSFAGGRV